VQVDNAWLWALALNALSWYMQIHPGHIIFEKKRAALVDSFVQAFLTAPIFVWMDLLFFLGYRQELHKKLSSSTLKST
jgi:2-hydroxy fatty acid dioxygenase